MQYKYITLGLYRTNDDALATLGTTVIAGMTDNPNFEAPTPALTAIQVLLDDFRTKLAACRKGSPLNTSEKNASRQTLEKGLKQLAFYVENIADGSIHIILSSGFSVRSTPVSSQVPFTPERLRLGDTGQSGQIRFNFISVKNAWEYEYSYATEMDEQGTLQWGRVLSTTNSRNNVIAPLAPGSTCYVRVRARNGKGISDWSEAVSLLVR